MSTFQDRLLFAFKRENERRKTNGEKRLTQTALWSAAEATSGAASHWFKGGNAMSLDNCIKVAPLLKVNPYWLFDERVPMDSTKTDAKAPDVPSPAKDDRSAPPVTFDLIRSALAGALQAFGLDYADLVSDEEVARRRITSKLLLSPDMQNESAKAELPPQDKEPLKILGELGSTESQTEENGPHQRAEGEAQ